MDFHLKQRGGQQHQHQSEASGPNFQHQKSSYAVSPASANAAKIPKLLFEPSSSFYPHQSSSFPNSPAAAAAGSATTTLPLFVPEEGKEEGSEQEQEQGQGGNAHPFTKLQSSTFPSSDHHHSKPPRNSNYNRNSMGSYFSWAQWQELELQALIYRYMIAGATVPPELLMPIKKSLLLHSSLYFHHNHFSASQYPPSAALLHSGYWARAAMDPEPGRCRRTDGKKWRCSRDVVVGQKYCERHMHRGRNRSRKPVEIPTTAGAAASAGNIFKTADSISTSAAASVSGKASGGGSHFSLSGPSPSSSINVFHPNQSNSSEVKTENRGGGLFTANNPADTSRPDGHVLRHFFDDWPRSLQDSENAGGTDHSSTCLSISDVSLKLSTGNGDKPSRNPDCDHHPPMSTWASGWGSNHLAPMGGPLAEALRSSSNTAHSSPKSVLHNLARGLSSEASFVST